MSGTLTRWIQEHGLIAVFLLMGVDALLPVGGELIMLFAGVVASGVGGLIAYGLAGSLGYLVGALAGWWIGRRGGRELVERHGRLLHLGPERFHRAEAWFDRHGSRAVFLGRITPLVRSFISIPAGVLGSPLGRYTVLTLLGSLIWCFAFAGAGYAAGGSWESLHHAFHYLDYAVLAGVVVIAVLLARRAGVARRSA